MERDANFSLSGTIKSALLLILFIAALASASFAQPAPQPIQEEKPPKIETALLADVDKILPGAEFRIGVLFDLEKDWHIYWKNPGDAGIPTEIRWGGPEGFVFSSLEYPAPVYFGAGTDIAGYGYEGKVLLFSKVRAPGKINGPVTFTAAASWLSCKNKCIRGSRDLTLTLPAAEQPAAPGAHAAVFDDYARRVPVQIAAVPSLQISGYLSVSAVVPDSDFEALFIIRAPKGAKIQAKPEKEIPALSPFAPTGYEIRGIMPVGVAGTGQSEFAVLVRAHSFPGEAASEKIGGVLQFDLIESGKKPVAVNFAVDVPRAPAGTAVKAQTFPALSLALSGASPGSPAGWPKASALALMLLFAFAGGVLLNIMPCVLPVVSIKVLSLVKQADLSKREIRNHGLYYSAGILASFLTLAAVVAVLKSGGEAVGWGFQFQSPIFVSILAAVVFVFGLSLLGVWEITAPVSQGLTGGAVKKGFSGSFVNGIFATVLATPCTAPFLGAALGFAFTQPVPVTFLIFAAVAIGLAFPFLALAFWPRWVRFMPKPGDWMETFKALMGFLLMATVVWLLDVLGKQVGAQGLVRMLVYLGVLGLSAWILGRFGNIMRTGTVRNLARAGAAVLAVGGGLILLHYPPVAAAPGGAEKIGAITWEPFSVEKANALAAQGRTVFVDFTAAWCWTCKVNEKSILQSQPVEKAFKDLNIAALKGDLTNQDPVLTSYMKKLGRAGVPLYLVIRPGAAADNPLILPEVITRDMVIQSLHFK